LTRKTPYLTLAALAVLFAVMVGIEQAAASGDDDGGNHTSEYGGHGAVGLRGRS
jgi:hypothetical protein